MRTRRRTLLPRTQAPDSDTGSLEKGESKTITFTESGTFKYICTFHPFMTGTVEVK